MDLANIYTEPEDTIKGDRIYCIFKKSTKPVRASTHGAHNVQHMTIEGNPAIAIIIKKWRKL